jgi:membrane associated rhomboid family serine protease
MLFPLYVLNPRLRFPIATLLIIVANLLVMGWLSQMRGFERSKIAAEYGFVPARLTLLGSGKAVDVPVESLNLFGMRGPQFVNTVAVSTDAGDVYRSFFSMMFLHGGWMHLLMNMWMLWLFGPNIEDRLGHLVFAMFYALGGVVAMLAFWASAPAGRMPVIGASGAVAAVLGAYAVTFPGVKVRTLFFFIFILIFDLPALALLGVWFMLQILSGVLGLWGFPMEPVAFWAHVGGFVAGMILMPLLSFGASPPGADWRKETDDMFRFEDPRFTNQSDGRN